MEFKELKKLQAQFDSTHKSTTRWDTQVTAEKIGVLEHLVVCLVGEVGEFANITKKISRGDITLADAYPSLASELADTFIYLLKISNQANIDLEAEFLAKLAANRRRFAKYEIDSSA